MINLYRAEWRKVTGNRCLVGCTVWFWPIVGFLLIGLFFVLAILDTDFRQAYTNNPPSWTDYGLLAWVLPTEETGIARLPFLAFAAAIFVSEYQQQTWKAVLPGNPRWQVIGAKFLAMATFIIQALFAMMIIVMMGLGGLSALLGSDIPPALTASTVVEFLKELLVTGSLTFILMIILSGIAALLAVLSRSMVFTVTASIFFSLVETLGIRIPISLAYNAFDAEGFSYFYLATPTYNINNLLSYYNHGHAFEYFIENGPHFSAIASLITLLIWLVVLIGGTMVIFSRQDIQ